MTDVHVNYIELINQPHYCSGQRLSSECLEEMIQLLCCFVCHATVMCTISRRCSEFGCCLPQKTRLENDLLSGY